MGGKLPFALTVETNSEASFFCNHATANPVEQEIISGQIYDIMFVAICSHISCVAAAYNIVII